MNLPNTPHIPSSLEVVTPNSTYEFGDYLSEYEVAPFLNISSDDAKRLIESGELDCFMTKIGNSCVFSKIALEGWMNEKLGV
ncbi:MAG: helix-turn-helix domain-containing protein [Oscillospiraceae bacterium]